MLVYMMMQPHVATEAGACRDEANRVWDLIQPLRLKHLDENVLNIIKYFVIRMMKGKAKQREERDQRRVNSVGLPKSYSCKRESELNCNPGLPK